MSSASASPWPGPTMATSSPTRSTISPAAADLISIRGRQSFFRPFTRVDDLRRRADDQLRANETGTRSGAAGNREKLSQLEAGRSNQSELALSPEQEAELTRFQQERVRIRKELRDVRRSLDVEIEGLGTSSSSEHRADSGIRSRSARSSWRSRGGASCEPAAPPLIPVEEVHSMTSTQSYCSSRRRCSRRALAASRCCCRTSAHRRDQQAADCLYPGLKDQS